MFGLLNSSQIYGIEHETNKRDTINITTNAATFYNGKIIANSATNINTSTTATSSSNSTSNKHTRFFSAAETSREKQFLNTLNAVSQGMKSPTNFIEKFIRSELLNGYDTIRNYKNFHQSSSKAQGHGGPHAMAAGVVSPINCLQGSYRSNVDGEFYKTINLSDNGNLLQQSKSNLSNNTLKKSHQNMIDKPSTESQSPPPQQQQQPRGQQEQEKLPETETLSQSENYQKLSDSEIDQGSVSLLNSSGASSGEFNSSDSASTTTTTQTATTSNLNSLLKRIQTSSNCSSKTKTRTGNVNESTSDNSSSSVSTSTTSSSKESSSQASIQSNDNHKSLSSATSNESRKSNFSTMTHRRSSEILATSLSSATNSSGASQKGVKMNSDGVGSSDQRSQRRKLMQMISNYEQQNKMLQHELAKEKRRRNEDLACVVKSLLCFESKLKTDMKSVNQRLLEKDAEICRLVRQNRALRKQVEKMRDFDGDNAKDEGVEEDGDGGVEDCLVLEALQCNNCRKQFYDIDTKETEKQTGNDGGRNNDDHITEIGTSSDDTVSSSFYGARRSVRYTSKRTAGTFRDYMRSRSMHIDDDDDDEDLLQQDNSSEINTSSISRNDSRRSYDKINVYSRTIERMHGVKGGSGNEDARSHSRASNKSSSSSKSAKSNLSSSSSNTSSSKSTSQIEEDDGIFSPTQDDDFEEEDVEDSYIAAKPKAREFSETSPKQVYETSTDDWYASASDQEDTSAAPKSYGQNAVNPVLECVNQILLQQSMEEPMHEQGNNGDCSKQRISHEHSSNVKIMSLSSTPKIPSLADSLNLSALATLPRRSSLSGRHSSRSNSHSSEGPASRNGTLTRKRVHFSTKNSMVHVPRNDDLDHEFDDDQNPSRTAGNCMLMASPPILPSSLVEYNPMNYFGSKLKGSQSTNSSDATPPTVIYVSGPFKREEPLERLDTLNYESIYSNEYEPIGSEHNSSNLYVDMESAVKLPEASVKTKLQIQLQKLPPALPPKPANLLKFKKALQQLDEMPDEHLQQQEDDCAVSVASTATVSEPDYCSISEINMSRSRSVQIVAEVHKPPESEPDSEQTSGSITANCGTDESLSMDTQKTEEIEEILADIPKLPNVAAIIAPKQSPRYRAETQSTDHYLIMSPKLENVTNKAPMGANNLPLSSYPGTSSALHSSKRMDVGSLALSLEPETVTVPNAMRQYKQRKHLPNILAEINKRMYNTLSPSSSTPTGASSIPVPSTSTTKTPVPSPPKKPSSSLNSPLAPTSLPLLQAEFDWYNLDAEYGKSQSHQFLNNAHATGISSSHTPDILKVSENLGGAVSLLEEINEDHESVGTSADEYNLDEEFSLTCDRPDLVTGEQQETLKPPIMLKPKIESSLSAICEAVNFPLVNDTSLEQPSTLPAESTNRKNSKKIKKNLENFEKFIEGSGLSMKSLPSKRKIYFAGPFV